MLMEKHHPHFPKTLDVFIQQYITHTIYTSHLYEDMSLYTKTALPLLYLKKKNCILFISTL